MSKTARTLARDRLFAVAARAQVDPRTVQRVLDGKPTRQVARLRVEAELKEERR